MSLFEPQVWTLDMSQLRGLVRTIAHLGTLRRVEGSHWWPGYLGLILSLKRAFLSSDHLLLVSQYLFIIISVALRGRGGG